ncbi:MAG: hypothetical protein ACRDRV_16810 [Pseudonocardiaceae bacterium]
MSSKELLGTYLNDHYSGAMAGSELAQKISEENAGNKYGSFLSDLAREVDQDRATLEDLISRLGIEKNPVKEAAGWVMEKFSRIKLSESLTGNADLKRLLEFETLSLGIEGKLAMWRALSEVSATYPELAETDLDGLAKRAENQRATIEEHRLEVASAALGS